MTNYVDIKRNVSLFVHKTCHYRESAVGQEKIALTKKLHCQAISLGIPVLAVALPELAAHGHKAQLDFASAINTTISFTESALLAGEGQICLLCVPGDEDAALTLGTALHLFVCIMTAFLRPFSVLSSVSCTMKL